MKIKIHALNTGAIAVAALFGSLSMTYAEGVFPLDPLNAGGVTGANRRVRTQPYGYDAVYGIFQVPTVFIPIPNSRSSSPSFYLGSGQAAQGTETDAGIYYEWEPISYTDNAGDPQEAPPGWAVIFRVSGGPNPGFTQVTPRGWRTGYGTPNPNVDRFTLTYVVHPSLSAYLDVNAHGAVAQPGATGTIWAMGGGAIFNNLDGMFVKRVVAISQGGRRSLPLRRITHDEDGSFSRGNIFTGGYVATQTTTPINWTAWSNAQIDQVNTGYYPGGQDKHIPNTPRNARGALPVINFPDRPLSARDAEDTARYDNEWVDINLRRFRRVEGRLVRPRQPNIATGN